MMRTTKISLILLTALFIFPFSVTGQEVLSSEPAGEEPVAAEPAIYIDFIFNEYIELEDSILNEDADLESRLYDLRKFRNKVEEENRRDILSRLDMLDFIIKTRLDNKIRETEEESIMSRILTDEELRATRADQENLEGAITAAAIGTTIASGLVYLGSSILYEDFYSKYTETDNNEQAAFYLFWWQIFESASVISGITTAAAAVSSGILSLVF